MRALQANQFEVRAGARRHSRQARRYPAGGDQQLGHGIDSGAAARQRWRTSSSRAADCSGSPASATSTSTRRARRRTPLERALPAKLAPPRIARRHGRGADHRQIVVDGRRKIELARLAAIGVVENLRPIDSVGVLIFDNSFQWAVPIRKAEDRATIKRLISGITPDGGTQIAPALTEAYARSAAAGGLQAHRAADGRHFRGGRQHGADARRRVANHVTISTVGLGQDVNRAFLEKVAHIGAGQSRTS